MLIHVALVKMCDMRRDVLSSELQLPEMSCACAVTINAGDTLVFGSRLRSRQIGQKLHVTSRLMKRGHCSAVQAVLTERVILLDSTDLVRTAGAAEQ